MDELRAVPGYGDRYAVTCDGRVWSHAVCRWRRPYLSRHGYLAISIELDGRSVAGRVHVFVALAWVANPRNLPFVNHKDGDKTNNHFSNLEWCTSSENLQHAWDTGLRKATAKLRAAAAINGRRSGRFSPEQIRTIRQLTADGSSHRAVAAQFGVTREAIRDIASGKNYRHVPPTEPQSMGAE